MKLFSALTVIAIAAAGPALAEGKCATGPKSKWQPKSTLETQLQADGYKVRQIKVEGGCYEVYATDKDGKRANMAYNSNTYRRGGRARPRIAHPAVVCDSGRHPAARRGRTDPHDDRQVPPAHGSAG